MINVEVFHEYCGFKIAKEFLAKLKDKAAKFLTGIAELRKILFQSWQEICLSNLNMSIL